MRRILMNEVRLLRRQPALWLISACYLGLLAYGAVQSVVRVNAHASQVATAVSDFDGRWAALRAAAHEPSGTWASWRSPSLIGGASGYAVTWLALDGLAVLSPGESIRQPSTRRISIYNSDTEPPLENPLTAAGGVFELSFVVIWLLPVTVLAAGHAAVSGDRQQGTWPLVSATTAAPAYVLFARLMWPAVGLACATLAAAALAVAAAGGPASATGWMRFAAWSGAVLAYTGFWTMAAGVATARSTTAPLALTALGLCWMTLVWVVPGLVDAAVTAIYPVPNRLEAHLAAREVQRDLEPRLLQMVEDVYAEQPEWRPSPEVVAAARRPVPGGPASRDSRRVYVPARAAAKAAAPFVEAVARRRERTERLVRRAGLLSPALAMQLAGDHLAGTSATRFVSFEAHAAMAEREWHGFFAPRIMQLQEMSRADMDGVPIPKPFWANGPDTDAGWPASGLMVFLVLAGVGYRRALSRL